MIGEEPRHQRGRSEAKGERADSTRTLMVCQLLGHLDVGNPVPALAVVVGQRFLEGEAEPRHQREQHENPNQLAFLCHGVIFGTIAPWSHQK